MRTRAELAPLRRQVMVITGASSGIGLATARLAARRGARVVLSAWDEPALREATEQIRAEGGDVIHVVADVTDLEAMKRLARTAVETYGRIDTWVSNAGVHTFGELMDTSEEDMRRVLDVNYWGTVHSAKVAVPHLAAARGGRGGALLIVGSVESVRAVPLQGIYSASKHAVKGFTDALRVELESEGLPIVVTLLMPAAIHTPITEHTRNVTDAPGRLPPPVYDVDVVARAIIRAAEKPRRQVVVGGTGHLATLGEHFAPRLTDAIMKRTFFWLQKERGFWLQKERGFWLQKERGEPPEGEEALHEPPIEAPHTRARQERPSLQHSLATWLGFHKAEAALVALGVGALALLAKPRRASGRGLEEEAVP